MRNKYFTSLWEDPLLLLENSYPDIYSQVESKIIMNSNLKINLPKFPQLRNDIPLNVYEQIKKNLEEIFKNHQIQEENNFFKILIKFITLRQNRSSYHNWYSQNEVVKWLTSILDKQIPDSSLNLQDRNDGYILSEELEEEKKDVLESKIRMVQTLWRQNFRARKLHHGPNLFGHSSKNTRLNSLITLPKDFRNLLVHNIPTLIENVTHVSTNIRRILHNGKIYSKQKIGINGIGVPVDKERDEHRLVFTSPWHNYGKYGKNFEKITLATKSLFENKLNHKEAVYFKFVDWGEEVSKVEFKITDHIKIVSDLNNNPSRFGFFKDKTCIAIVELGWEHLVYHGLDGLKEYLTFFIFKVLNKLPPTQQHLKTEIYNYFGKLDPDVLILHLQEWMKKLLFACEFDFVNDLKINFESIIDVHLCYSQNGISKGNRIDFSTLRQALLEENRKMLEDRLVNNEATYELFANSYALAKGLLDYAKKVKAHGTAEFIKDQFKIISHYDSFEKKSKLICKDLNLESFNIHLLLTDMQSQILKQDNSLINIDSLLHIEQITKYCNQKFTDQAFFGNDALNRKTLLDDFVAQYLDDDTILQILHLAKFQKNSAFIQVKRNNSASVTLADILNFGFLHPPKYLKLLPNNDFDYNKEKYNIQKFKFEENTKKIMLNILFAADKIGIDVHDKKYRIENTNVGNLFDRFQNIVEKITEIKNSNKEDLLLYVPSYSLHEIRSQALEGFRFLCRALYKAAGFTSGFPLNFDLNDFVHHIFLNEHILLDGRISHLFYDRVHLEACIESNFKFTASAKEFTIIDLFSLLLKRADEESIKGFSSIVSEQFDARFALIEKHLEQFCISSSALSFKSI